MVPKTFVLHRGFLALLVLCVVGRASASPSLRWISSTQSEQWKELQAGPAVRGAGPPGGVLKFDPQTIYQTIDGFGGCFNDLGWQALLALAEQKREAALKELFDPDKANFTLGRAPMGANDFSLKAYSFSETPGDYAMKDFSIEWDRRELIPYLKAAMKYQPKLGIWGVPWSPPAWMKTNGHYKGGHMRQDAQTLAAYALYFSKYVQAYRAEGINLYAVMPQNEPNYNDNIYPQCQWTGAEVNIFLRDFLVPRFHKDNLKVDIWLGTIAGSKLADYIDPVLRDSITNPAMTGIGYQYAGQSAMLETHEKYPAKKLAQTETECYNGQNTWEEGMNTFGKIIDDTNHFASSYFFWNMILNESGRSTWNWCQNSLLTVDRKTDGVRYNPEFYAMKHFSAAVLPGARRIAVSGGPFKNAVAFRNPSGSMALIFANETGQMVVAEFEFEGSRVSLNVPARSMNTITLGNN